MSDAPVDAADDGVLDEFPAAEPDRRRRSGRRIIGATVAGIALIAAGAVTVGLVLDGSSSGGARSPEAAVFDLVSAVQEEDVLGALEAIDPAERDALRAAVEDAAAEGQRLDVIGDTFTLDGVPGVDLAVQGLRVETEELAPDLALVHATDGEVVASFDKDAFPVGAAIGEIGSGRVSDDVELADVDEDLFLATVERDGTWYVSLSYTVAEYARRAAGLEPPDAGAGVAAEGFATPEEAAQALLDRLVAADFNGLAALAAPGDGDAIRRYAPLWLGAVMPAVEQAKTDGLSLAVDDVQWEVDEDGNHATAKLESYTLAGTLPRDAVGTSDGGDNGTYGVTFDPSLPTVIALDQLDSHVIVVPAGTPVPDAIDDTMERSDSSTVFDEYGGQWNYAYADASGAVSRYWDEPSSANSAPEGPASVKVVHEGDCSTVTGDVGQSMATQGFLDLSVVLGFSNEPVDGGFRLCSSEGSLGMPGLNGLFDPTLFADVPRINLTRVDGQWYVSPVGSLANVVVDQLRSMREGEGLDSPAALYVYGTTRPLLEFVLSGNEKDQLSAECQAIAEFDEDGKFERVIDDPSPEQVRACQDNTDVYAEEASGEFSAYPDDGESMPTVPAVDTTAGG